MNGSPDLAEYQALVSKVDAFFDRVSARYAERLRCGEGCSSCCGFHLTVSPVEAAALEAGIATLPANVRRTLAERGRALAGAAGPCPALDSEGRCSVYAWRPIVCRTHGVPMRVPGDARLPVLGDGVGAAGDEQTGGLAVCHLNFEGLPLSDVDADCVLNLESIDALLAVVNVRAFAASGRGQPLERVAIGDVLSIAHVP
jgi:hypothetical protein